MLPPMFRKKEISTRRKKKLKYRPKTNRPTTIPSNKPTTIEATIPEEATVPEETNEAMETDDPFGDPLGDSEPTTPAILKHLTPQSEENHCLISDLEVFDVFNEQEDDDFGWRILTKHHPTPELSPSPLRANSSPSGSSPSPSRACSVADASNERVSANRSRSLFGSPEKSKGIGKGSLKIARNRFVKEVNGTNITKIKAVVS